MKILVAGDWHSELHEEAVSQAFQELGHEVLRFGWHTYFQPASAIDRLSRPLLKAQNKYMWGPRIQRLNRDLIDLATQQQPTIVFIYRGTHVLPETLRSLRVAVPKVKLLGYNNDDPFSPRYPRWLWRHFLGGIALYDLVFAYRTHNLGELTAAGARQVDLLRSWYMPQRNYPHSLSAEDQAKYGCDVVFVGHYEQDGRLELLEDVVRQGWHLRLFGPDYEWNTVLARSPVLAHLAPVHLLWGADYNKALCGAKAAMCFLSRLNRDTYTRRCFEIPASGTVLLSEYSDDLASLFVPDREAVMFRNRQELHDQLNWLLRDESRCQAIALAGLARVRADGHDVVSRMRQVLARAVELPEYAG
ncbi:MAG: hypothetical protein RLZZ385_1627 [Pseudomonadota bacterium]|jgi:hypothetical protein